MDSPVLKAPAGATKKRKIIGRGSSSGHGGTSTKGSKGQNARAGGGVRLGFEGGQMPLFRRIARRGFSNARFKVVYRVVNLGQLGARFSRGDAVTQASLEEKGLIKGTGPVKILGAGDAPEGLTFEVDAVSQSAREKIAKAGGAITGAAAVAKPPRAERGRKATQGLEAGKAANAAKASEAEKAPKAAKAPKAEKAPKAAKAPKAEQGKGGATEERPRKPKSGD